MDPNPTFDLTTMLNLLQQNPQSQSQTLTNNPQSPPLNLPESPQTAASRTQKRPEIRKPKTRSARKQQSWSTQNDKLLATAYLSVSKNPILENGQKKAVAFWERVAEFYNAHCENRDRGSRRSDNQCKQHWHIVNGLVSRFERCYCNCGGRDGMEGDGLVSEARRVYKEMYGREFVYEHVWVLVKDEPKWKDEFNKRIGTGGGSGGLKRKRNEVSEVSGGNVAEEEVEVPVRDVGENLGGSSTVSSIVSRVYSVEEGKISMAHRMADLKEKELENQVIYADVTKLTSLQRKIHDKKLEEIMEKYGLVNGK